MGDGLKPTEIGYLPQQTAAQKDFPASAYEVFLQAPQCAGHPAFYSRADKAIVEENIQRLTSAPYGIAATVSCPAGTAAGIAGAGTLLHKKNVAAR
jgi:hypothetical protein